VRAFKARDRASIGLTIYWHTRPTALIGEPMYPRSLLTLQHRPKSAGQVRKYCSPFRSKRV